MHNMTGSKDYNGKHVLYGTLEDANPLSKLRGNALVWTNVFGKVDDFYTSHIDRVSVANKTMPEVFSFATLFPKPNEDEALNINMMPIKINQRIPGMCSRYHYVILNCQVSNRDPEHVAYVTIQEGWVPVGQTQRRPGLHIERPGSIYDGGKTERGTSRRGWGMGSMIDDVPKDGIYMASSVADSCKVWPVLITSPEEVTDSHGGMEPMRKYLGEGRSLKANELCWITDRTPHEALPIQAPADDPTATMVYRQFFRLVAGKISVWHSKHNTPNPEGVLPDAPISDEDKFAIT
jgi:hypothetical protein